ncbi:hypothetical protein C8E83_2402 [Frondihabitans australicus]|uniref:Uncharacterized protein n=1 Tax=Frondihabitans australicus TaxID=386892 RepID=A0A495IGX2_9MICO|nr:hypothetical protein C8E83_2402 [Frondihabitans australicus]
MFADNLDLSAEEINSRFAQIDGDYAVGQRFSPVDEEFVTMYATPIDAAAESGIGINKTLAFSKSRTSGGVTGAISGSLSTDGSGPVTHRYAVSVKATSSAKATKMKIQAEIRSYGVIGSGGLGLTYSASPSVTTTAHSYSFSRSGSYTSVAVYDTISASATIYSSGGSFSVTS